MSFLWNIFGRHNIDVRKIKSGTTDLKSIILKCDNIDTYRDTSGVYFKLAEEVGELATEINVKYHGAYKNEGKDSIIGGCVDSIIYLYDIPNK